jgi:hypothetical protein
MDYDIRMR